MLPTHSQSRLEDVNTIVIHNAHGGICERDTEEKLTLPSSGNSQSFLKGSNIAFGLEGQAYVEWEWPWHSIHQSINQGLLVVPGSVQVTGNRNKCQGHNPQEPWSRGLEADE